jgi:hypothetical protein
MIRALLGRIGAYALLAVLIVAFMIGGLAERAARPKSQR